VVVPNYNHGHLLPRCLNSILSQSRQPDELLILDDGSTDNSLEVISRYAENWPIIRVIRIEQNKGVLLAFRRLAEEAAGELVLGCAADDELCPDFIAQAMTAAEACPGLGVYLGRTNFRTPAKSGTLSKDKVVAFGWSGELSPEEFSRIPSWLEPHLLYGISVSAILNRQWWLEVLPLTLPLGPWSDTFERIAMAAKHGCYLLDVPGHIFYKEDGGYSRKRHPGWAINSIHLLIEMVKLMSHPSVIHCFPMTLRNRLAKIWANCATDLLETVISDSFYKYSTELYESHDLLSVKGKTMTKAIGKITGLGRTMQLFWLRYCLKKKFMLEVKGGHDGSYR
jgi:glycosyltransferase involved in cell wall biosynthesis